ncbi:hypothetical protein ACYOEI_14195 [Singulisphaera rosea]
MNQGSGDLSADVARMSDAFSELGERLLAAARQLHSPGTLPPEALVEALSDSRHAFQELRGRVRERAGALGLAEPPESSLDSLQGVNSLLDSVIEAEIGRAKGESIRRRALGTLERVTYLTHTSDPNFTPIRECLDRARELHDKIADGPWSDLPREAEQLAEGDHPFSHLLILTEGRDELDDDRWASFHESISSAFGKSLAAAAARSKLSVSSEAPPFPADPSGSGFGGDAGSRRYLGKASQGSR